MSVKKREKLGEKRETDEVRVREFGIDRETQHIPLCVCVVGVVRVL